MLVYANSFIFEPENGPEQVIQQIAKWAGQLCLSDGMKLPLALPPRRPARWNLKATVGSCGP